MKVLKRSVKIFFRVLVSFFIFLISYALLAFGLSRISVNNKMIQKTPGIDIYILSNGVHTDIVVPVKNEIFDWTTKVSPELTLSKNNKLNYLAIGWGDKGFYLNTPTWADLKFSTAFKAATGLSSSAMHCTFYKEMKVNGKCKKIMISEEDYKVLIAKISESFQKQNEQFIPIITKAVYGKNDVFYEAIGSYNLFYTCNTWSNSILKKANQKAALWTVSEAGIFQHYE